MCRNICLYNTLFFCLNPADRNVKLLFMALLYIYIVLYRYFFIVPYKVVVGLLINQNNVSHYYTTLALLTYTYTV